MAVALVLGVWGCGGKASEGGFQDDPDVAATDADLRAMCDVSCARDERCDGADQSEPRTECVAGCVDKVDLAGLVRADIVRDATACARDLACDLDDDTCMEDAAAARGITTESWRREPDVLACRSKFEECASDTPDICFLQTLFVTRERERVAQCFTLSCSELTTCLEPLD